MDLQYLLWLQDFRNSTGNVLTPFMEFISHFAITYLILLPVFIFCWLGILYITVKPYPMDLNAEGKLIEIRQRSKEK